MRDAVEIARELLCRNYGKEQCEPYGQFCQCYRLVSAIRATQRETLDAAKACVKIYAQVPDCPNAHTDFDTGTHECLVEINGGDCLCAHEVETAEKIVAALDALMPKETE